MIVKETLIEKLQDMRSDPNGKERVFTFTNEEREEVGYLIVDQKNNHNGDIYSFIIDSLWTLIIREDMDDEYMKKVLPKEQGFCTPLDEKSIEEYVDTKQFDKLPEDIVKEYENVKEGVALIDDRNLRLYVFRSEDTFFCYHRYTMA